MAEREGFEPSEQVALFGGLANRCTRPAMRPLRVYLCGGRSGIRTHGCVNTPPVFETDALNHSAIPPHTYNILNEIIKLFMIVAEGKGFEPLRQLPDLSVFKTELLSHLSTPPYGWGSWTRTNKCRSQSPVPYLLAIAQYISTKHVTYFRLQLPLLLP